MVYQMNTSQKFGLTLLIFCVIMWFFVIPTQVGGMRESTYPRFVTVWIAISSVFLILQSRRGVSKRIFHGLENKKRIARVVVITITFLIYVLMIGFLGFYVSGFLFLVMVMLSLGVRDWKILILMPSTFLLFLYFLIERLLVFPLPKGRIF